MLTWRHIVLATDFSACSNHAATLAEQLALKFDARFTLVHVWEVPAYAYPGVTYSPIDVFSSLEELAVKALHDAVEATRPRIPSVQGVLRRGAPAEELLAYVTEAKPDLVVIGTHGRRGAAHLLLGSVAERVVQRSPVPVLTVRPT